MKLNYKNTAIRFLEDSVNFPFDVPEYNVPMSIPEKWNLKYHIRNHAVDEIKRQRYSLNIQYVTKPLYDAYLKSIGKIREVTEAIKLEDYGTLIIPRDTYTLTIFYFIKAEGKIGEWDYQTNMIVFAKHRSLTVHSLDCVVQVMNHKSVRVVRKEFSALGWIDEDFVRQLILFKTFLRYAVTESKIVNAQRKERHLGEKYVNETKYNIQILDSTYFTTISRTEGFGVKGHFRLQPYGPGLTQKRLQWISDYQKQGYTRKAKILDSRIE